jgi:hypothetical protein
MWPLLKDVMCRCPTLSYQFPQILQLHFAAPNDSSAQKIKKTSVIQWRSLQAAEFNPRNPNPRRLKPAPR